MARSFTGRKRIRRSFGRIPEVAPMPNLIEVQKSSVRPFPADGRPPRSSARASGCRKCSNRCSRSTISPSARRLEFVRYELEQPKYDVEECQQRGMTFAAPLKVTLAPRRVGCRRGHRLALDPRHQGAGRLHGRHAAHDQERHLHHQRHRARHRLADAPLARRVLRPRQGQDPFLGQVSLRRARHPLSRLVARFRVRRQGPRLCAHRPAPQAAGDDAALCARQRRDREAARPARGRRQDAAAARGAGHVEGGDPRLFLRDR